MGIVNAISSYWWAGNTRSRGIGNYDIGLFLPAYQFILSTGKIKFLAVNVYGSVFCPQVASYT